MAHKAKRLARRGKRSILDFRTMRSRISQNGRKRSEGSDQLLGKVDWGRFSSMQGDSRLPQVNIPVVFMTAADDLALDQVVQEAGGARLLRKPFSEPNCSARSAQRFAQAERRVMIVSRKPRGNLRVRLDFPVDRSGPSGNKGDAHIFPVRPPSGIAPVRLAPQASRRSLPLRQAPRMSGNCVRPNFSPHESAGRFGPPSSLIVPHENFGHRRSRIRTRRCPLRPLY